ncbi:MAG TPA: hypothetical protein VIM61_00485 [Chthoniobacterales bacterium]
MKSDFTLTFRGPSSPYKPGDRVESPAADHAGKTVVFLGSADVIQVDSGYADRQAIHRVFVKVYPQIEI